MPPPPDTNRAAPASRLPARPSAVAVPPSVVQTRAAPPGCLSECRARPTVGPLAATPADARPASNTPCNCSSDNPVTALQAGATSPAPDSNARSRTPSQISWRRTVHDQGLVAAAEQMAEQLV